MRRGSHKGLCFRSGWRLRQHLRQRRRQKLRFESKRPGLGLKCNMSLLVNQIQTIRPPSVGLLCAVAKFIQHSRDLNPQLANAGSRNKLAFFFVLRRRENHVVFYVALHLPNVARVGLGDVNHQERDAAAVLLVELIEGGNLPPEGRSSVAAEHENDGLGLIQLRELHPGAVVKLHQ